MPDRSWCDRCASHRPAPRGHVPGGAAVSYGCLHRGRREPPPVPHGPTTFAGSSSVPPFILGAARATPTLAAPNRRASHRATFFTGLSRADLDPLHLMYFIVVVVAAVDAVDNVSLAKSGPVRRCAYRCVDQKITRGGSWDQPAADRACPLIIPRLSRPKITVVHSVFPTCVL